LHGLILTAFRDFTESEWPEAHEEIWAGAPAVVATAVYDDSVFAELAEKAAQTTGVERPVVLRRFGIFASLSTFRDLYPDYYGANGSVRDFLLGVEERIHELVRLSVPGAAPPRLRILPFGHAGVAIAYTSERQLCQLLEGLVIGVSRYYGEPVTIEQPKCMLRGDETGCSFFVTPTA
jgi:hypothetical protein